MIYCNLQVTENTQSLVIFNKKKLHWLISLEARKNVDFRAGLIQGCSSISLQSPGLCFPLGSSLPLHTAHYNILWKREGTLRARSPEGARTFIEAPSQPSACFLNLSTYPALNQIQSKKGGYIQTNQICLWRRAGSGVLSVHSGSRSALRITDRYQNKIRVF